VSDGSFAFLAHLCLFFGMFCGAVYRSAGYDQTCPVGGKERKMSSYSSFDFNGNRVTIGMMNDMIVHEQLRYTYNNNVLSFELEGATVNIPMEVINNNTHFNVGR
jgi:hypothetical protein